MPCVFMHTSSYTIAYGMHYEHCVQYDTLQVTLCYSFTASKYTVIRAFGPSFVLYYLAIDVRQTLYKLHPNSTRVATSQNQL